MEWLDKLRSRYRWSYVGAVRAETQWQKDGKNTGSSSSCFFLLRQRGDGLRKFTVSGDKLATSSPHGKWVEATVRAWAIGGPLPQLYDKPTEAPPKPRAKLIAFPGGKTEQD